MVCKKCEKKLATLATPDTWKDGSRNKTGKGEGARKLNENKLLSKGAKSRFAPYSAKCKVCKSTIHQQGAAYCQQCAYKKGICSMCGTIILDTKDHKQSTA
eukprot:comp9485_c0_seq1/m.4529 comp9485_c0_seq1/g.4529  ORF comp9485_c0_seq1/g.4529 comp9485_c0_seq1/m.4529 type:complete len:101 (-) comp9485_c0_seq1:120-422(-)